MDQPNYGVINSGSGTTNITNSGIGQNVTVRNTAPAQGRAAISTEIGVITVLSEETAAMAELLRQGFGYRQSTEPDGTVLHEAMLETSLRPIRTVLLQSLGQGQRSAIVAYQGLRRRCEAQVVALVGIAGGIHPQARIGDVVVADEVIYYDRRRDEGEGVQRRSQSYRVTSSIQRGINAFFSMRGEPCGMGDFTVWRGPIASGEAVIASADSDIRQYLRRYSDKILAVETEAGGVAQGFYEEAESDSTLRGWLTIRGVSDYADAAKDDRHRWRAAQNAAKVLAEMAPYLVTG